MAGKVGEPTEGWLIVGGSGGGGGCLVVGGKLGVVFIRIHTRSLVTKSWSRSMYVCVLRKFVMLFPSV